MKKPAENTENVRKRWKNTILSNPKVKEMEIVS